MTARAAERLESGGRRHRLLLYKGCPCCASVFLYFSLHFSAQGSAAGIFCRYHTYQTEKRLAGKRRYIVERIGRSLDRNAGGPLVCLIGALFFRRLTVCVRSAPLTAAVKDKPEAPRIMAADPSALQFLRLRAAVPRGSSCCGIMRFTARRAAAAAGLPALAMSAVSAGRFIELSLRRSACQPPGQAGWMTSSGGRFRFVASAFPARCLVRHGAGCVSGSPTGLSVGQ